MYTALDFTNDFENDHKRNYYSYEKSHCALKTGYNYIKLTYKIKA